MCGMSNEGTVFELTSPGKLTSLGRNPTIDPLIRNGAGNLITWT
jgi:hypothetical protein